MKNRIIRYAGTKLFAPEFLVKLWPNDMQLEDWPSFCGAGSGVGDWIVPDKIRGARIAPACFIHDIAWAISDGSWSQFHSANNIFHRNLQNLITAQIPEGEDRMNAISRCSIYCAAVSSSIGWKNYEPTGEDPFTNPVVREKLKRLSRRQMEAISK